MRVITGLARGRRLQAVPGDATRPTSDRIKEAMFSILQFDLEGRVVLDLFAGAGQLGIEALSRGALQAVFVDNDHAAVRVIRDNIQHTKLTDHAVIHQSDAFAYLSARPGPFDIIFLDPPYQSPFLAQALSDIAKFDILRPGGIIMCETEENVPLPEMPAPYRTGRTYRYGKRRLAVYTKDAVKGGSSV